MRDRETGRCTECDKRTGHAEWCYYSPDSCRNGGNRHSWNDIPGHRIQCDDCGTVRYTER